MTHRRIAVCNQKGGVGKTTTAVNLATALCSVGCRVLLVDFDPQSNATSGLGISTDPKNEATVYQMVLGLKSFEQVKIASEIEGLDVLPADIHLSAAELELPGLRDGAYVLKNRLAEVSGYDYVFIDCPPSLNYLTLNALVASDGLLIPLQCEYYALEGLAHLLETVKRVRAKFNPKLELEGIVLTMFDTRNKLSSEVAADVRANLGKLVFNVMIPRNVRVSEAPSHGLPVLIYDLNSSGAEAYIKLAAELLEKTRYENPVITP